MSPRMTTTEELPKNTEEELAQLVAPQAAPRKYRIIYLNLFLLIYGHLTIPYSLYLACTVATWNTLLFLYVIHVLATIGVTAGTHRLWTHRAYKAKMPLQILLMIMQSIAHQNPAAAWVLNHRMHHKYSDTDADPHNATRGFFYSHIGWFMVKKHEDVKKREKFIDMSDIYDNPVLMFQKKYGIPLIGTMCFVLPTVVPMYFFSETLNTALNLVVLRYLINLHSTALVNSYTHMWGNKPYDKTIKPTQNLAVSFFMFGEGFHNYHHVFPWDYRTAELGNNYLNMTTLFIDFFAWLGWAYDLKTASDDIIKTRSKRTGDGSSAWSFK